MCDSNENDISKVTKRLNIKDEKCKKCNNENGRASILLRNDDKPFCKECFIQSFIHKFRSEFGKSHLIRQGEKVLVGFSGGQSSIALLQMIKIGLSESSYRKLRFIPDFIYIDEGQMDKKLIKSMLEDSGFPYRIIDQSELDDQRLKKLNDLLTDSKTATSKQAVKTVLIKDILTNIAQNEGFKRVLLASNCTRLSILTLSNLAQGTGSGSADFVAFHDNRFHVSVIQPFRQFSVKEITFLNHFYGNKIPTATNEETRKMSIYSINKLTENFIASLATDFPATILTISRTAEKIHQETIDNDFTECSFCKTTYSVKRSKFDPNVPSASNALQVALELLKPNSSVEKIHNDFKEQQNQANETDNKSPLCYSCKWLLKEIDPSFVKCF